jgi:ferredoxin-NADP reductase
VAGAALLGRLTWQPAEVVDVVAETPRARTIVFDVPGWPGHRPGQHVDVRLTAEDGYQAQRSYSIASAAAGTRIELTVERLDDGEVSPFFHDIAEVGDAIELRGPIGGHFVWDVEDGEDVIFRNELLALDAKDDGFQLAHALTRDQPWREQVFGRRVDAAMVAELVGRLPGPPRHVFVCGGNPFVEAASQGTIEAGVAPSMIRTERYGG